MFESWITNLFLALLAVIMFVFAVIYFLTKRTEKRWLRSIVKRELAKTYRCPYCGALLYRKGRYCSECGKLLAE